MPTNRETGKDRWKRVPKDYFKKPDGLGRVKFRLSALALVLTLGWCALGMDWAGKGGSTTTRLDLRANHGELAKVHAAWDRKCEACHEPFKPIDGRPLLASRSVASERSSDRLCMGCHAGPAHHAAVADSAARSCAECHRDHRGREASLVRLPDLECTRCHASLESYTDAAAKPAGSRKYAGAISRFDVDHPPFRPDAAVGGDGKSLVDRGGLKFNHALHMSPGMVKKAGDTPYTVGSIPVASERARYGKAPGQPVQLDCASCHVLEASDLKAGADPAVARFADPVRSDGKYYQPVRFEAQCRACHDLNFDPKSPEIRAPHGVQPEIVVDFVKRAYAAQMFEQEPKLFERFTPATPLPGKAPAGLDARKDFDRSVNEAEAILFGENKQSCHECHSSIKEAGAAVPRKMAPTDVPTVWFTHAQFDHSAHRGVSCRDCHAKSYALEPDGKPVVGASVTSKDVLIPGIENCKECHSPARSGGGWLPWSASTSPSTGGVAHDCTECHTYHNGDHALEGVGASTEDALLQRTIGQFLLGTGGEPNRSAKAPAAKP